MKSILLIALLVTAPFAASEAGLITPDNPLYPLDLFIDWLEEQFAGLFGNDVKMSVILNHMRERLEEVNVSKNNTAAMITALINLNAELQKIEDLSEKCSSICLEMVENATKVAEERIQEIMEKAPKECQYGLETALENIKRVKKGIEEMKERFKEGWHERYHYGWNYSNYTHSHS